MKFAEPPVPRHQINLIPRSLDEVIPQNSPIRLIDEILDLLDWDVFNQTFRNEKRGRPPIPPRIMVAIWIWAFFRRVRSSRDLEYQLNANVEFMWLAHGHRIDHSTLSAFRKSHGEALKTLHKNLVRLARDLGIIKIAELYVDATRIKANASRSRTMTASKAEKLLELIDQQIENHLAQMEAADAVDNSLDDDTLGDELPAQLAELHERRRRLKEMAQQCQEMDAIRKKQGIDPTKNPFQLPITDPDSRILPNKEGGYAPNYTPMIAVEGELGIIVSTVVFNSTNEQDHLLVTVDEVESSYGVTLQTIGADAAYSTGENIHELEVERQKDFLSPHRNGDPATDNPAIREDVTKGLSAEEAEKLPTTSRGTFSNEAFVYDAESDQMYCPDGRPMPRAYTEAEPERNGKRVRRTIYQSTSCEDCPLTKACRGSDGPFQSARRVMRHAYEEERRQHRGKMSTPEAKSRYHKRLSPGERPFGQIKQHFGVRRFQVRGQSAVESEFSLAVIAQTIQRLANHIGGRLTLRAKLAETG
jgi:transposase